MRIIAGLLVTLFCSLTLVKAQNFIDEDNNKQSLQLNTITTAVPFLLIGPDARHGTMGDVGVATKPDATSMHWNPAKYAFVEDDFGFAVCYTPWLRALIPDITLSYLSGYVRTNDNESFGFALRYFSLGDITFTNIIYADIAAFFIRGHIARVGSITLYLHNLLTKALVAQCGITRPV